MCEFSEQLPAQSQTCSRISCCSYGLADIWACRERSSYCDKGTWSGELSVPWASSSLLDAVGPVHAYPYLCGHLLSPFPDCRRAGSAGICSRRLPPRPQEIAGGGAGRAEACAY